MKIWIWANQMCLIKHGSKVNWHTNEFMHVCWNIWKCCIMHNFSTCISIHAELFFWSCGHNIIITGVHKILTYVLFDFCGLHRRYNIYMCVFVCKLHKQNIFFINVLFHISRNLKIAYWSIIWVRYLYSLLGQQTFYNNKMRKMYPMYNKI